MKRFIVIYTFLILCTSCHHSISSQDLDKYTIQYSIGQGQFGVVIAEDEGISKRDLRKYALQKAAEVAHKHGYRYFVINNEMQVTLLKTEKGLDQQQAPHNMYYSLIQSQDFGRDQFESKDVGPVEQVSGYQIEFSCQENKPSSGKYFDTCDEGWCD